MRLEITKDLKVRLFRDNEDIPFFEQPNYPDNSPWLDAQDCERWGNAYLNWMLNPDIYPQPPSRPIDWETYQVIQEP